MKNDELINIGYTKNDFRKRSELIKYFQENKKYLIKGYRDLGKHHEPLKVHVLSNNNGWCTYITEKGMISHCWAGEITIDFENWQKESLNLL